MTVLLRYTGLRKEIYSETAHVNVVESCVEWKDGSTNFQTFR